MIWTKRLTLLAIFISGLIGVLVHVGWIDEGSDDLFKWLALVRIVFVTALWLMFADYLLERLDGAKPEVGIRGSKYRLLLWYLVGNVALADGASATSPRLYFEMGGGEPVKYPIATEPLASLALSTDFASPLSCDLWDAKHSYDVEHYLRTMVGDHVRGTIDKLGEQILVNIEGFAEGLIVGVLQRAVPGLYDYSQNVHAQLSANVEIAQQSCEAVSARVRNGNGPLSEWRDLSDMEAWKEALGVSYANGGITFTKNQHILSAQDSIARNGATQPVRWYGSERGNDPTTPINVVNDTIRAGYQLLAGSDTVNIDGAVVAAPATQTYSNPNGASGAAGTSATRAHPLGKLWANDQLAADWAVMVLGEKAIAFCAECSNSTFQSGAGLMAAYQMERDTIADAWRGVLTAYPAKPDVATMRTLSGGRVFYTVHVVDAVMQLHAQDRAVYVDRLVADAALSMTVEKAMAIRRMIRVAQQTPDVEAYPWVSEDLVDMQTDIKTELEELKWEIELQQNLSSKVAASLLDYQDAIRQRGYYYSAGTTLDNGAATDTIIVNSVPVPASSITANPDAGTDAGTSNSDGG